MRDTPSSPWALTKRFRWRLRGASSQFESFVSGRHASLLGPWASEALARNPLATLPPPELMLGMSVAVGRVVKALELEEPICVFADYDVDGISAASMLRHFFRALGHGAEVYIPDRFAEGYGLNALGLEKIAARGGRLVITVDNGISAVEACRRARELGVDVIVTDHHDVPDVLPEALALLNPKQHNCPFPYKALAGVGVAFYLMAGVRARLREKGHRIAANINLKQYLDFVALGTIADMAPLDGVNHILCRTGLEVLRTNVEAGLRPGLAELLSLTGWKGDRPLGADDVGFQIGPRLNAVGRLGSALAAEELLVTQSLERARDIALQLDGENRSRQDIERATTKQAMEMVGALSPIPAAIVVGDPSWHTGVVGLVASRLVEKYYRPALVFGETGGKFRFSGRSTHAVDLFGVLNSVREEFIAFGGHFHAVGLTLEPERLPWLCSYLAARVGEMVSPDDTQRPLDIDAEICLGDLNRSLLTELESLEPFGVSNPRPRWLVRNLKVQTLKRIGRDPTQNHARVLVGDGMRTEWVTAFGFAHELEPVAAVQGTVDVVLEGRLKIWNGEQRIDLRLVDHNG